MARLHITELRDCFDQMCVRRNFDEDGQGKAYFMLTNESADIYNGIISEEFAMAAGNPVFALLVMAMSRGKEMYWDELVEKEFFRRKSKNWRGTFDKPTSKQKRNIRRRNRQI